MGRPSPAHPSADPQSADALTSTRFNTSERNAMLALGGVGETVIGRLEQIGYRSLAQLRDADPAIACAQVAGLLRSSCWSNSPQARGAISAIVHLANSFPSSSLIRPT